MTHRLIYKLFLPALTLALGLSGCVREEIGPVDPAPRPGSGVLVTVRIPGARLPNTRSIADDGGEAKVHTIDLLVFEKHPSLTGQWVLSEHVTGDIVSQSASDTDEYEVQFSAELTANSDAQTVVVIANAADQVDDVVNAGGTPNAGIGGNKAAILQSLNLLLSGSSPDDYKWRANNGNPSNPAAIPESDFTPIPMYGEYDLTKGGTVSTGIAPGMSLEGIELIRMLARIDVVNHDTDFTLTDIYIVNYNDGGYLSPAFNTVTGAIETSLPATPMIPSGVSARLGETNAMRYSDPTGIASLIGEIYVFEAPATSGVEGYNSHKNAMCVVVAGTHSSDSRRYFYRLDFTNATDGSGQTPYLPDGTTPNPAFNAGTVAYMPVLRNHHYTFTIGSVGGPGYTAFDAALSSLGVKNNMRTHLLTLNLSGLTNTVFDGNHYLSLGPDVVFEGSPVDTKMVACATNHHAGWKLDPAYGSGTGITYEGTSTGWLQVTAAPAAGTIELKTRSVNSGAERVAWVHVNAGRLTHKLKVTQQ